MRLLFAFAGGRGHAEPLVPLAAAAAAAGHEVAFAGRRSVASQLGFEWFAAGADPVPRPRPLVPFSLEREERVLREAFAGEPARAKERAVRDVCATFAPDAIVCDEVDFGSMAAAQRLGLPFVEVLVTAEGFVRREVVGAQPAPALALSPFPPSLRDPGRAIPIRLGDAPRASGSKVYVTLGTVFPIESGDLLERILAGLADLDVVVSEPYVPQAEILPGCAAVVCHAGSGTVLGALAHGLPLVCLPIGADQPFNAARCAALGAGIALDPLTAAPADLRDAVTAVRSVPSYREAAERIAVEVAALPGPDYACALIERVAGTRGGHDPSNTG